MADLDAGTVRWILVVVAAAAPAYMAGYLYGLALGESRNWLTPTIQRQARELRSAWNRIERAQEVLRGGDPRDSEA